jgi:hypothetical protein
MINSIWQDDATQVLQSNQVVYKFVSHASEQNICELNKNMDICDTAGIGLDKHSLSFQNKDLPS